MEAFRIKHHLLLFTLAFIHFGFMICFNCYILNFIVSQISEAEFIHLIFGGDLYTSAEGGNSHSSRSKSLLLLRHVD